MDSPRTVRSLLPAQATKLKLTQTNTRTASKQTSKQPTNKQTNIYYLYPTHSLPHSARRKHTPNHVLVRRSL